MNYITGNPNPELIGSPDLKIIFKSLMKKDDVTKEKAMNEFLNVLEPELLDDVVIPMWVQLYPKLSIDNSRNIRILSHKAQSTIVKALGKRYAKYLKDTAPSWLSGLFDNDRVVSRATSLSLIEAFASQEKIGALWKLFEKQILEFVFHAISLENSDTLSDERVVNSDERQVKFSRVATCCCQLFAKLLSCGNFEKFHQEYSDILALDELWDLARSKDLQVKRSLLSVISPLVSTAKKLIYPEVFSKMSSSMFKVIKLPKTNQPILYSGVIISILQGLCCLNNFDSEFWGVDKKPKQKLIDLLRLGSCSSHESYYSLLSSLLDKAPITVIDYQSKDEVTQLLTILAKNVESEKLRGFSEGAWDCYLRTLNKSSASLRETVNQQFKPFLLDRLSKRMSPSVLRQISDFLSTDTVFVQEIKALIEDMFPNNSTPEGLLLMENAFSILVSHEQVITEVATHAVSAIREEKKPSASFHFMWLLLKAKRSEFKPQIDSFVFDLPLYVSDDYTEPPLRMLVEYSRLPSADFDIVNKSLNGVFLALKKAGDSSSLKVLDALKDMKNLNLNDCPDIEAYIHEKSSQQAVSQSDETGLSSTLFEFLNPSVLLNLYASAQKSDEGLVTFTKECYEHYDSSLMIDFAKTEHEGVSFLVYLWTSLSGFSLKLLNNFEQELESDKDLQNVYVKSFLQYRMQNELHKDTASEKHFSNVLRTQGKSFLSTTLSLFTDSIAENVKRAAGNQVDYSLSISNGLGCNLYLCDQTQSTDFLDPKLITQMTSAAFFLVTVIEEFSPSGPELAERLVLISLVGELAADLSFVKEDVDDVLLELKPQVDCLVQNLIVKSSNGLTQELLFGGSGGGLEGDVFQMINKEINGTGPVSYYHARVLATIVSSYVSSESRFPFKLEAAFLKTCLQQPFMLAGIVVGAKKFLAAEEFDRSRNIFAAELIGIKSGDILTKGLLYLTLLNNFFDIDVNDNTSLPVPAQRMVMVLRDLSNWLDSDLAYEAEFVSVRVQMLVLCMNILKNFERHTEIFDKALQLSWKVSRDSVGMVSVEWENGTVNALPLEYFTLKNYLLLWKHQQLLEEWPSESPDLQQEIIELLFITSEHQNKSQPFQLTGTQLVKALDETICLKVCMPFKTRLFELINSESVYVQKIACQLLHRIILKEQQDFVVEFELNKPNYESSNREGPKIPECLIQNVLEPSEEHWELGQVSSPSFRYLLSWFLILDYFKDITYSIRQAYVHQLKSVGVLNSFLTFAATEVVLSEESDAFKSPSEFQLIHGGYSDVKEEIERLTLLVYYLAFKHLSSLSQQWFLDIRNRQEKIDIEKFSVKYICPILITENLNGVEEGLGESSSLSDENLTFKINRVTNEVKSQYLIDEQRMEMSIRIPASYPLSNIIVEGPQRIGVKEAQWKAWLLSSQRVVSSQNGTIVEAVELFNKNVQLHFSGFEECAICYSILHSDHSLPTKSCTTCNNRFHSGCLYKWFKSSGASTCPLCRSAFNFRAARG